MGWPVYSERFLSTAAFGTWTYRVPTGMRAVVTNIDVVNAQGVVPCDVSVRVAGVLALYVSFQAAWRTENRATRLVAYAGDAIELHNSALGIHSTVGGYLFVDPSGRTAAPAGPATKPIEPDEPELTPHA